jgi:hypothetical protein
MKGYDGFLAVSDLNRPAMSWEEMKPIMLSISVHRETGISGVDCLPYGGDRYYVLKCVNTRGQILPFESGQRLLGFDDRLDAVLEDNFNWEGILVFNNDADGVLYLNDEDLSEAEKIEVWRKGNPWLLHGTQKVGVSWEGVPTLMTNLISEFVIELDAIPLGCTLSPLKRIQFRYLHGAFEIYRMSYNFQVLLGFYGFGVTFPLISEPRTYRAPYNSPNLPQKTIQLQVALYTIPVTLCRGPKEDEHQRYLSVIPYILTVEDDWPPLCTMKFTCKNKWTNNSFAGVYEEKYANWLQVNPTSGTLELKWQEYEEQFTEAYVDVDVELLTNGAVVSKQTVKVTGYINEPEEYDWEMLPARNVIRNGETVRMGLFNTGGLGVSRYVDHWEIPVDSEFLIKFLAIDEQKNGTDDGRTVQVQALPSGEGVAEVIAHCYDPILENYKKVTGTVRVISDQVEYVSHTIEAPYVGYGLSTPQLYVTTNIGYQVVRNSFTNPNELSGSQVCAVLQNSFSAGMYLNGAGDFPITLNQFDLSNLEFRLVDSNYHPVKLMSPMFVIMKIEPAPDPAKDIKPFKGKLPLDAPARQAQKQQQQRKPQRRRRRN